MVWLPSRMTRSLCHCTALASTSRSISLLRLFHQILLDLGQHGLQVAGTENRPLEERAALRIVRVLVERGQADTGARRSLARSEPGEDLDR